MYLPAIGFLAIEATIPTFTFIGTIALSNSRSLSYLAVYSSLLALRVSLGCLANWIYLRRARSMVCIVNATGDHAAERLGEIQAKGGCSDLAMVIGILVNISWYTLSI
jgi:hypothetical protein